MIAVGKRVMFTAEDTIREGTITGYTGGCYLVAEEDIVHTVMPLLVHGEPVE